MRYHVFLHYHWFLRNSIETVQNHIEKTVVGQTLLSTYIPHSTYRPGNKWQKCKVNYFWPNMNVLNPEKLKIVGAILNLPANQQSAQPKWLPRFLFYIFYWVKTMDNGHVKMAFFKNIPNNWPIWADEPNKLWDIWGISSWTFSTRFVIFQKK